MHKILILISLLWFIPLQAQEVVAKIDFVRGKVLVNGKAPKDNFDLIVGDSVEAIAQLKPKKTGSFVRVVFNNGDKLGISKGKVIIEKLTKKQSVFSLLKGRVFNYAKPGLERKVTIKSRNVSVGVRGTKYMMEEVPNETYICVCEGEVEAIKGGRKSSIKAGYDLHVLPGRPINQSVEASKAMMDMVVESFAELGEPVEGYKK